MNNIMNEKKIGKNLQLMLDQFAFFGIGSAVYGLIFTLCLYYGFHGISLPVLMVATSVWVSLVMKKFEVFQMKKILFYSGAMLLLGISSFLTMDLLLLFFNTVGIILLLFAMLLDVNGDTKKWGFVKFVTSLIQIMVMPLSYLNYPIKSLTKYISKKDEEKNTKTKYIWLGAIIAIPFLFVIVGLLVSADAVFSNMFTSIFTKFNWPNNPFKLVFLLAMGCLFSYCVFAFIGDEGLDYTVKPGKKLEPVVAITFLSLITVVYLIFSVIQILYLFIGNFELPEGYTYATYAREGFFQLLALCILNLIIILFCVSFFGDNVILKVIMTVFSICTYIMIASSALRMYLYVSEYDLSYLRIMVFWGLIVIGCVFFGCMIQIWKKSFPLFQYAMVVVTVLYLGLSFMRPETLIAEYNLSKKDENIDYYYLLSLSTDATPVLNRYGFFDEAKENYKKYQKKISTKTEEELEGYSIYDFEHEENMNRNDQRYLERLDYMKNTIDEMGILDFNLSLYKAGKAMN